LLSNNTFLKKVGAVVQPAISTLMDDHSQPAISMDDQSQPLNPPLITELSSYFERPILAQEPSINDQTIQPANRSRSFLSFSRSMRKWYIEMAAGKRQ
jgi:hypothetical protein